MIELENLPVDITDHVRKFRDFLNVSWPSLDDLMENHDWDDDGGFISNWIQVNWELLVERELVGKHKFLTEFSTACVSPRITSSNQKATYIVIAKSDQPLLNLGKNKVFLPQNKPLRLFGFCSRYKEMGFGIYPPFDLVDLVVDSTKELFIVPFDNVRFYLNAIKPPLQS